MSYVRIWLHCVWGTKSKSQTLSKSVREEVINHIRSNAVEKGVYIDSLNGSTDHLHCLLSLDASHTLKWVMQNLKGESSYWVNKHRITRLKFGWAVDYYAVSISSSDVARVRGYIRDQEYHHGIVTRDEELAALESEEGLLRYSG